MHVAAESAPRGGPALGRRRRPRPGGMRRPGGAGRVPTASRRKSAAANKVHAASHARGRAHRARAHTPAARASTSVARRRVRGRVAVRNARRCAKKRAQKRARASRFYGDPAGGRRRTQPEAARSHWARSPKFAASGRRGRVPCAAGRTPLAARGSNATQPFMSWADTTGERARKGAASLLRPSDACASEHCALAALHGARGARCRRAAVSRDGFGSGRRPGAAGCRGRAALRRVACLVLGSSLALRCDRGRSRVGGVRACVRGRARAVRW